MCAIQYTVFSICADMHYDVGRMFLLYFGGYGTGRALGNSLTISARNVLLSGIRSIPPHDRATRQTQIRVFILQQRQRCLNGIQGC